MNTYAPIPTDNILIGEAYQELNSIIYWCDEDGPGRELKEFYYMLPGLLGPTAGTDVSPSECLWMFPLWESFEVASK